MPTPDPAATPYILLGTFRRNGVEVRTPLWCAPFGSGKLVIYSRDNGWKVKRMRATPRVRFASCDVRGAKVLGPWFQGTARELTDPAEMQRGLDAIGAKYRLQFAVGSFLARLTGGARHRIVFEIAYGEPDPA